MQSLRFVFATLLLGSLLSAGCGTESPTAPGLPAPLSRALDFVPVPAEIVVAIDVSDSTSTEELGAVLDGLAQTLGINTLVDPNGLAEFGLVAYGDTAVVFSEGLVPYDAATADTTLLATLASLGGDRRVGGGSAQVLDALAAAQGLLSSEATTTNRHVVLIGGGFGLDAPAFASATSSP